MATARRTGTNEAISTYGGATRGTSALSTWEVGTQITTTGSVDKVSVSSVTGDFEPGELLNFGTSGATAVFIGLSPAGTEMYYNAITGNPAAVETITGATSTETAQLDSEDSVGGVTPVIECYDDSASFDDGIEMNGATTSATFFRMMRPAGTRGVDWQGHDGTTNNGFFLDSAANRNVLRCRTEENVHYQDIIVQVSSNNGDGNVGFLSQDIGYEVVGILIFDGFNSGAGASKCVDLRNNGTIALCLADNDEGEWGMSAAGPIFMYNCVSVDNTGDGYESGGGTVQAINCIAKGNSSIGFRTTGSGNFTGSFNNAADDATAPGTDSRDDQTFGFVSEAGDDWHLLQTDGGARNFGKDLSADSDFAFNDDIDAELFVDWDIGMDEPGEPIITPTVGAAALAGVAGNMDLGVAPPTMVRE